MKFQNPSIHRSKVSNFTEKWKNQSNLKILYFCQNLTESSQKLIRSSTHQPKPVYQLKYFSRYLAHKIFKFCFQREITQERGITRTRKKIWVNYFFMRNTHMKFQTPNMLHSKVNRRTHTHTHTQTDRQAESNMPFQLFKSWGHKHARVIYTPLNPTFI